MARLVSEPKLAHPLLVSHDPEDARVLCDQVPLVADGVAHAPVATGEMFANPPEVMREYLG